MALLKLALLSLLIVTAVSLTSCQGQLTSVNSTETEVSDITEKPEAKEAEIETKNEPENEKEVEKPENEENEKPENEENEKPEKNENEKPEKDENEIDLEDDPVPSIRCLTKYNNLNCTDGQRKQAIADYKMARQQLIQTLLNSSSLLNLPLATPPTLNNSSLTPLTPPTTAQSAPLPSSNSSGSIYCDRAIQLLNDVDRYARFNDLCQARVFGKKYNPDFWIKRCRKALKRH